MYTSQNGFSRKIHLDWTYTVGKTFVKSTDSLRRTDMHVFAGDVFWLAFYSVYNSRKLSSQAYQYACSSSNNCIAGQVISDRDKWLKCVRNTRCCVRGKRLMRVSRRMRHTSDPWSLLSCHESQNHQNTLIVPGGKQVMWNTQVSWLPNWQTPSVVATLPVDSCNIVNQLVG